MRVSDITIVPANTQEATEWVVDRHYLHRPRVGPQMCYWGLIDNEQIGVIIYAWPRVAVTWHGFAPGELLELARLWITPAVQDGTVEDSKGRSHSFSAASRIVGLSLRKVRQHWRVKYPESPTIRACVAWSDDVYHSGNIYRASNFVYHGKSAGNDRPRSDRPTYPDHAHEKSAWIYEWRKPITEQQVQQVYDDDIPLRPARFDQAVLF